MALFTVKFHKTRTVFRVIKLKLIRTKFLYNLIFVEFGLSGCDAAYSCRDKILSIS